jgi:hypothetical protein
VKRFKYFLVVFSVFALLLSFSPIDAKAQPGPPLDRPRPPTPEAFCFQCCQAVYLACKAQCFTVEGIFPECVHDAIYSAGACLFAGGGCLDDPENYDCTSVNCLEVPPPPQ